MSLLRTLPAVAAACGLTLFAVASARSQDAPPPPTPPAGPAQHGGMMRERMEHRRAERLQLLHDALAIRSDQEGAWQAFAAAIAPQPGAAERRWGGEGEGAEHKPLTTPERLDRMSARMAEHAAAFQRRAAAVKALYAALSPAQQRTFDALGRLHGPRGGPGHGGWGVRSGADGA